MVDEVQSVVERWQSDKRLTTLDEAKVQQVIVLPILRGLGWNPDNDREVHPQYRVEDGKVDYALLIGSGVKVFIEAKNGGESLEKQKHQEQLLGYSFKRRVKIAVLTNGATWWFYLPLQEGNWEQRRFHVVEFDKQNGAEIAQKFVDFLSKENVSSGKAVQNAQELYKKHQISETLPEAWNQLVSEPDQSIVNRLAEKTQELCGRVPDRDSVKLFLSEHALQIKISLSTTTAERDPSSESTAVPISPLPPNPSDRSVATTCRSFTFRGNIYEVSSWGDMIVKLCEIMHRDHGDRFEEVLSLSKSYSRNQRDIASGQSKQISGTDIFVDTHGGKVIEGRAVKLITHFGYNANNLSCESCPS